MMLVAGLVFLFVTDGMTLFGRMLARRTEALLENGRRREGLLRIGELVSRADSVWACDEGVELFRGGRTALLTLRDSTLAYRFGEFRDTLLRGVAAFGLGGSDPDTVTVRFAVGFTARFAVERPFPERYRIALDEIERGYGYEE